MGTAASKHVAYIQYSYTTTNLKLTTVFFSISCPTSHNPTHTLRVIEHNDISRHWVLYGSSTL